MALAPVHRGVIDGIGFPTHNPESPSFIALMVTASILLIASALAAANAGGFDDDVKKLGDQYAPGYSNALSSLLKSGGDPSAVEAMTRGMRNPDRRIQMAVITLSRRMKVRNALFFAELKRTAEFEPDIAMRREAFGTAVEYPEAGRPNGLIDSMTHDANPTMRRLALEALVRHRGKKAIPDFLAALKDPAEIVRVRGAFTLAEVGDARGAEVARGAIRSADWNAAAEAIVTLTLIGQPADVEDILALRGKSENSVMLNAFEFAIRHPRISGKTIAAKAAILAPSLDDTTNSEGVWAEREAMILLTTDYEAFVAELKKVAKRRDSADLSPEKWAS